jgi:hypothetical protein
MVDELLILIWNGTKKLLAIVLSGLGWGEGDLTSVQYKPNCSCHNGSPLYNKYILIKNKNKKNQNFHTSQQQHCMLEDNE